MATSLARGKIRIHKTNYWTGAMANGWTLERRARQAELIRRWKPWGQSTEPRSPEGKERASRNAYKGDWRPLLRELARAMRAERETLENV